jgi:hypothetical protein
MSRLIQHTIKFYLNEFGEITFQMIKNGSTFFPTTQVFKTTLLFVGSASGNSSM